MSNGIDIHVAAVGDSYTVTVDGIVAYQTPFLADARRHAARIAAEWAALISQGTVTA